VIEEALDDVRSASPALVRGRLLEAAGNRLGQVRRSALEDALNAMRDGKVDALEVAALAALTDTPQERAA